MEPKVGSYELYRRGLLQRHVTCGGRYVSDLWLRERRDGDDGLPTRQLRVPLVYGWHPTVPISPLLTRLPIDTPRLAWTGERLFATWRASTGFVIASRTAAENAWSAVAPIVLPEGARPGSGSPALAFYRGRLYAAWTGPDSIVRVVSSVDGQAWGGLAVFDDGEAPQAMSRDVPSLTVAGDNLMLVWCGTNNPGQIRCVSFAGAEWANKRLLCPDERTARTPALARFRGRYYLAWSDALENQHVSIASSDDLEAWGPKRTLKYHPRRARTDAGPALGIFQDHLMLAWSGRAEWPGVYRTEAMQSFDGVEWNPKQLVDGMDERLAPDRVVRVSRGGTPGLAALENTPACAWIEAPWSRTMRVRPPGFAVVATSNVAQQTSVRTYVPWLDGEGANATVHGGGDNPLLRGGLLMTALAHEYQHTRSATSLAHIQHLLDYIEKCEATIIGTNERTGFFLRCRHSSFTEEKVQAASLDEIIGLVLGLFYVAKLVDDADTHERVVALATRLGTHLREHAYLLVPPAGSNATTTELHRGAVGPWMYEWALSEALFRITGQRFSPSTSDYRDTSLRVWSMISGRGARSRQGPRLLSVNGTLMLVWSGTNENGRIRVMTSTDGNVWSQKRFVSATDTTSQRVATAYFRGRYYVAWTGTNDEHHLNIISSADGVTWTSKRTFDGHGGRPEARSQAGPALLATAQRLYLGWCGTNDDHPRMWLLDSADGQNWGNKRRVNNTDTTESSPALCELNGTFYIAWRGTNDAHHLNLMSSPDGVEWGGKQTLDGNGGRPLARSQDGPELCAADGRLYLSWCGTNDDHPRIRIVTLQNGAWGSTNDLGTNMSEHAPALVKHAGLFYLAWTGRGDEHWVHLLRSDNAVNWRDKRTFTEVFLGEGKRYEDGKAVLSILYLWGKHGRLHPSIVDDVEQAFEDEVIDLRVVIGAILVGLLVLTGPLAAIAAAVLGGIALNALIDDIKQPFDRYLKVIDANRLAAYHSQDPGFGSSVRDQWFNFALLEHTLHYAIHLEARSPRAPRLATDGEQCLLVWSGDRDKARIHVASSLNGIEWPNKWDMTAVDTTSHRPACAFFKGRFYIAWTGTNDAHNVNVISSEDGRVWVNKIVLDGRNGRPSATSQAGPALLATPDRLYLAWCGTNDDHPYIHLVDSADGLQWEHHRRANDHDTTESAPSLAFFNGRYYLAWHGRDDEGHVNVMSSDDATAWGNKRTLDGARGRPASRTQDGPELCTFGDRLYVAWCGSNDDHPKIFITETANGTDWIAKRDLGDGDHTQKTPALVAFRNGLLLAYRGENEPHNINMLSSSDADRWAGKVMFRAERIAREANELLEVLVTGNRLLDVEDRDFYAAVLALGHIDRYVHVGYDEAAREVLLAREGLAPENPVGEPKAVREQREGDDEAGWFAGAPVRWHNSDLISKSTAVIGNDFCWEDHEGNGRILLHNSGFAATATGMSRQQLGAQYKLGDAILEAGGLDYYYCRALMYAWLENGAFEFDTDEAIAPLRACACLPFSDGAGFKVECCGAERPRRPVRPIRPGTPPRRLPVTPIVHTRTTPDD
jgi:predicted GH43/DUF377 family glycosyl hydrolase